MPGYKVTDVYNSFFHPEKSWCEYGSGKRGYETSDSDLTDDLNNDKKQKFCEGDYRQTTAHESYYDNRKSWCKSFD